jgi:HK97 family phage portal protein
MKFFESRDVLSNPPTWLLEYLNGGETAYTGESVSVTGSLKVTAVLAGLTILCEDTASLPLILYKRLERGKERAIRHPIYSLLHDMPNPEMTSMVFRELAMGHLVSWGNFYAQMIWDGRGTVRELWPFNPSRMEVFRDRDERKYIYTDTNGRKSAFRDEEILHIPAFGFDGLIGYSRISLARNAIGLSISAEKYGSKMFANDARPSVALKAKNRLTPEAQKNLRESWAQIYSGAGNAGKVAVLEQDLDVETIGFPPEDAQFLQTREFQISEIARIFRIPPHMLGAVDRSTSWGSGIEQQEMGYLAHTLRPWLVRIEQQMQKDLLLNAERGRYVIEHLTEALLRTDLSARMTAYTQAITNGIMSRNEARERENLNPIEGLDEMLIPLNMSVVGKEEDEPEPLQDQDAGGDKGQEDEPVQSSGIEPLLLDVMTRIARRETNELNGARSRWLEKGKAEKYSAWLDQFYKRDLPQFMLEVFKPLFLSRLVDQGRVSEFIDLHCKERAWLVSESNQGQAVPDPDPHALLESFTDLREVSDGTEE